MEEIYEIGEVLATTSEYTEILTMIYNALILIDEKLLWLMSSLFILLGILSGVVVGSVAVYFIGTMLKGK